VQELTIKQQSESWYLVTSGDRFILLSFDEMLGFVARWSLCGKESFHGMRTYEQEIESWGYRFVHPSEIAGLLTFTPADKPQPTSFVADFLFNPAA
jgi:hypothetical protein